MAWLCEILGLDLDEVMACKPKCINESANVDYEERLIIDEQ